MNRTGRQDLPASLAQLPSCIACAHHPDHSIPRNCGVLLICGIVMRMVRVNGTLGAISYGIKTS